MKYLILLLVLHVSVSIDHPENFPNMLAGTFTDGRHFSTGNTLPITARPWGFNHWAPQTKDQGPRSDSWWFNGNDHVFTWLRCTHQPSPWIGDWGYFLFGPQIGPIERNPKGFWEPRAAVIKPHLFDATIAPDGMRIEFTPTTHAAALRVTYPPITPYGDKRICFREARWTSNGETGLLTRSNAYITGIASQINRDRSPVQNFALHIRAESLTPAKIEDRGDIICFVYASSVTSAEVRLATSLISAKQAELNLQQAGPSRSFDDILQESTNVWNSMLRRVDVVDAGDISAYTNRNLEIFYTGLARALLFPRRIDETDASGKLVHWSPYDPSGKIHDGPLVTDNGFWDTFRTVYPLLGLAYRGELGVIVEGWLNAYREGGWLPSWASPGYRNCMVGTYADVVIADAIIKGITGFDLETARLALRRDSFDEPPGHVGGAMGKEGLNTYIRQGYVPSESGESVSRTLDFGFADFAVAEAFKYLASNNEYLSSYGHKKDELLRDAATLETRSHRAATSLYSPQHHLMLPKSMSGVVRTSFAATEWGNGYTEGNAWHTSFPPYALSTLTELHGGPRYVIEKLHQMLATPSKFQVGSYGQEIHEMTEMRALAMGQYGHNNQPSHHILYLFAMLGESASTEKYVRQVMQRAYGPDYYAGDEDNGEMGAWFVLSALGLYAAVPSTPYYVLGSPIFKHVSIARSEGSLDIVALGTSSTAVHVSSVYFNAASVDKGRALISDEDLRHAGVLQFIMEGEPDVPLALQADATGRRNKLPDTMTMSADDMQVKLLRQNNEIAALQSSLEREKQERLEDALSRAAQHEAPHLRTEPAVAGGAPMPHYTATDDSCTEYITNMIVIAILVLVVLVLLCMVSRGMPWNVVVMRWLSSMLLDQRYPEGVNTRSKALNHIV